MEVRPWKWFSKSDSNFDVKTELENIQARWKLSSDLHEYTTKDKIHVRSLSISSTRILTRLRQTIVGLFTQAVRGSFELPEWDFNKVDLAIQNESFLRRAIEKYVEQIWKNGFELTGKNKRTVDYVRRRMRQIAAVSGITTLELFQRIAYSLVAYNNVIIIKKRSQKASGGNVRETFDGKTLLPVAAYFVASPSDMEVDKDEYGVVRKWRQSPRHLFSSLTSGKSWGPDDVIFFKDNAATDSKYFFAMPMSIPVLPDIKALRETEELAMLQAIKFSIPRYHVAIGTTDHPGTQEEVDYHAAYFDSLPSDGIIVTSNRAKITNISSGDEVMDLTPYLNTWTQRILSGLGMSKVGMGDGSTANRATAQTMATEMQTTTIKYQQLIKHAIEEYIFNELLYETGYTEFTLDESNKVYLHIPEIDLENKIKKENHSLALFNANAITHDELRIELGRDVLSEKEKGGLLYKLIPGKFTAQANKVTNDDQPTNQYGTQSAKPKVNKDGALIDN